MHRTCRSRHVVASRDGWSVDSSREAMVGQGMETLARWRGVGLCYVLFAGCNFPRPADVVDPAAQMDASLDDAADAGIATDAPACFGESIRICLKEAPSGPIAINTATTIVTT